MSGRGASYPAPPPQIPAGGFPAPGSCRKSSVIDVRGLGGPSSFDPRVDASFDKPSPALRPGRASASITSSGRVPSLHAFRRRFAQPCSGASSVVWTRPTPPAFLTGYAHSSFPARPGAWTTAGDKRSPRFRRVPFLRDVASDPGRATVPRITAPHMLPSAVATASAPATSRISWLNPTPHKIAVYASPWSSPSTPQHSLPGGRYPLPGPDFHRLERASFAWAHRSTFWPSWRRRPVRP